MAKVMCKSWFGIAPLWTLDPVGWWRGCAHDAVDRSAPLATAMPVEVMSIGLKGVALLGPRLLRSQENRLFRPVSDFAKVPASAGVTEGAWQSPQGSMITARSVRRQLP